MMKEYIDEKEIYAAYDTAFVKAQKESGIALSEASFLKGYIAGIERCQRLFNEFIRGP